MTNLTKIQIVSMILESDCLKDLKKVIEDSIQEDALPCGQKNTDLEWVTFPYDYFKSKRFDCSKEHLLGEIATRAECWHKQMDGSYSLPKLGGQISQILEMAIAAKLKD